KSSLFAVLNHISAYIKPYIFSILPAGSVTNTQADLSTSSAAHQHPFIQTAVIQIISLLSLHPIQTLAFPFSSTASPTPCTVRLMTPSPSARSSMFFVTTPTDRSAATEGSSIWKLTMKSWVEQVDELVSVEQYADALALLDTVDQAVLSDKV